MHTTDYYVNRDVDAQTMLGLLAWGRKVTTEQAQDACKALKEDIAERIRNYKDTSELERAKGSYCMLLSYRKQWAEQGPFDDCSHWAGNV